MILGLIVVACVAGSLALFGVLTVIGLRWYSRWPLWRRVPDPDPEFCRAIDQAYQKVIAPHFPVGSPLGPRLDDQPAEVIQARADALRRQP